MMYDFQSIHSDFYSGYDNDLIHLSNHTWERVGRFEHADAVSYTYRCKYCKSRRSTEYSYVGEEALTYFYDLDERCMEDRLRKLL